MSDSGTARSASHRVSMLLLGLLALFWGYNWVVMKVGIQESGPLVFAALRMLGGAALLVLALVAMRRSFRIVEPWTVMAIGLTQTTAAQGLIAAALHGGQAGKSAVLNYTLPIWVMILSTLFLKVRPKLGQWVATGVALAGIVTMAFVGSTPGSLAPVLFALAASFCWGVGVVLTQSLLKRHPGIDTVVLTTWQMIFGAALLGVIALLMPEPIHWTSGFVLSLLYNIGPATAVAFLLWFTLQRRIDATVLSLIVLIVPLVGIAAGWAQLGEQPSTTDAIGMALILAAIAVMVLSQRRRDPAPIIVPADN